MQRTGKQKVLLVFSIIGIIVGILAIVGGLATVGGGAVIFHDAAQTGAADTLEAETALGSLAAIGGIIIIAGGVFSLLMGIFGIRAANDATKVVPFIVFAIISFISDIVAIIAGGVNVSAIISIVLAAVVVWLGLSIRKEAESPSF